MKEWFEGFWKTHGSWIVLVVCTAVPAVGFMFVEPLQETGKTVLIGILMILFNRISSNDNKLPRDTNSDQNG